jgi:hypothetical protein
MMLLTDLQVIVTNWVPLEYNLENLELLETDKLKDPCTFYGHFDENSLTSVSVGSKQRTDYGTEWSITIFSKSEASVLSHVKYHLNICHQEQYPALRIFWDSSMGDLLYDLFEDKSYGHKRQSKVVMLTKLKDSTM